MKTFLLAGAAAAATMIAGAAVAQSAAPVPPAPRTHVAKPMTRADVQARVAKIFARLDTNHDGYITQAELDAMQAQRDEKMEQRAARFDPSKIFDRLDLNHDGKITVAEVDAARAQRAQAKGGQPVQAHATAFSGLFARADTNKDNVVTRAEFDAMGQQIKARMQQAAQRKGSSRLLLTADANKDGKVSLAEMQQVALAQFDRLDLNHDGTITPQERQQARAQHQLAKPAKATR